MRRAGSTRDQTWRAIRAAGIRLIADHGYEAASLRLLAREVGVQAGSLYNHFGSKQEFLARLLTEIMQDLLAELDAALAADADPVAQLRAFVALHIRFHTARKDEVFIGNMELRSLTRQGFKTVTGLRGRYEDGLQAIIERGMKAEKFGVPDARVAAFALIAMLTGVCTWYDPRGRLSQGRLIDLDTDFAFRLVGYGGR